MNVFLSQPLPLYREDDGDNGDEGEWGICLRSFVIAKTNSGYLLHCQYIHPIPRVEALSTSPPLHLKVSAKGLS